MAEKRLIPYAGQESTFKGHKRLKLIREIERLTKAIKEFEEIRARRRAELARLDGKDTV